MPSRQPPIRERINQKARTRRDLLAAAQRLLAAGSNPTVLDIADEAEVSRATAYRYFPTLEQLLVEAALEGTRAGIEGVFAGAGESPHDVPDRVERLAKAILLSFRANEHLLRTMIRLTIDPPAAAAAPRRGYRRLEWINMAIAPLRGVIGRSAYERLADALAVCLGTEAFIVLADVCGKTGNQVERTTVWTARALVGAAMASIQPNSS